MLEDTRINKDMYYLSIARTVSLRSTCLRRTYGAVIVANDEIIATGYNGAPRGMTNCNMTGICYRQLHNIPSGMMYEKCVAVHAEANAIISAARRDMLGATLYLYGIDVYTDKAIVDPLPCAMCARLILNSGISKVITPIKDGGKIITREELSRIARS